ncbi:MAG: hypothetical protein EPN60_10010 [Nevskiaceae bacterium]|nr:MAG: hypothetical protein EPN60_10010 [Nevskiaceae bacterium]
MNLKLIAPLLLSLSSAPAFAHSTHDDEVPQPPVKQEAPNAVKAPAVKPKTKHAHDHAAAQEKAKPETPVTEPAAEPKKAP